MAGGGKNGWPRLRFRFPIRHLWQVICPPATVRTCWLPARVACSPDRYPAIELLVVDNGSREPEAMALLSRLEATARVGCFDARGIQLFRAE